ncbi:daunorubicin resistance protein DrrA family ABC transporter ATP-binding protein [Sphaerisporangium krabiense]|uniref:ABC-2 type transport system ATP-binding protein n=1 Tax=Sphaerisporangium krabiense TaxID=763782 RepID=A0A7W8Z3Y9_9ACTN|nr:ATP-binding cassette domain-containing protein [Sphaerisporangium krabiense]MBB5626981.1 ABC-2 type transport system ATP-binding protein [Sphaerisporangium krabiense]GII66784.1 daunorubicin resistance protein DrrA family ABC transporter ATP-binding protein [Sphaerisporangium krabiense]
MDASAVTATGLRKRFKKTEALRGLDLEVPSGTVFGLLGPNGSGKTTTVKILTTLLRPDAGTVRVAGFDALRRPAEVRARIGLAGQSTAIDEQLSGRENLEMVGRLYHLPSRVARERAAGLLERFALADTGKRLVSTYSGGMRRRLDLAAGVFAAPPVLFLDEPTTGLDPRRRSEMWSLIGELVAEGTTVLLTTQYLEEADRLADHVAVMDHGKVIASGTPAELKRSVGGEWVDVVVSDAARLRDAAMALERVTGGASRTDDTALRVSVPVTGPGGAALTAALRALDDEGVPVADIALRRPTLDEVFLHLTRESDSAATS